LTINIRCSHKRENNYSYYFYFIYLISNFHNSKRNWSNAMQSFVVLTVLLLACSLLPTQSEANGYSFWQNPNCTGTPTQSGSVDSSCNVVSSTFSTQGFCVGNSFNVTIYPTNGTCHGPPSSNFGGPAGTCVDFPSLGGSLIVTCNPASTLRVPSWAVAMFRALLFGGY